MTDRDYFAAAALTGLLAQGDDGSFSEESYARAAYRWADAMLRERGSTNHDAAPAARSTNCGKTPHRQTSAPPCVETDGFSSDSRTGITRTPERESPRRECEESQLRDVPQDDNSRAAGGPEHRTQEPVAWAAAALTDEEREAVEWCIFRQHTPHSTAVTLHKLLERLR